MAITKEPTGGVLGKKIHHELSIYGGFFEKLNFQEGGVQICGLARIYPEIKCDLRSWRRLFMKRYRR
jgi:hypothetical protein